MPILVIMMLLFLEACGTKTIPLSYNCPTIQLPIDPIPFTRSLTLTSQPDEVIKAWVATAMEYKGWDETVRKEIQESK